eukprot:455364-Pyramimonas_sp.AAC.1
MAVWKVVMDCFDESWTKRPIGVEAYELHADRRRLAACQPTRQRVNDVPLLECDLLNVKPPPPKPRKRKARPTGAAGPARRPAAALVDAEDDGDDGADGASGEDPPGDDHFDAEGGGGEPGPEEGDFDQE